MPENLLVPVIILVTSLAAYIVGRRQTRTGNASLKVALGRFFECLGAFLVFFTINVSLIFALTLLVRTLGGGFISFYAAADVLLIILSAGQAVLFSFWWHSDGRKF